MTGISAGHFSCFLLNFEGELQSETNNKQSEFFEL